MRVIKNGFSQLHRFVFWAIISTVFWAWIFTLVTDTVPARKVTLYVQMDSCEDRALSLKLEETRPEGIRMVKVHPFSYAAFGNGDLLWADLYVVRESDAEEMLPSFAPIDGERWDYGGRELYRFEGSVYGVKIYDAATGEGAALAYLGYEPDTDYYLFFNAASSHLGEGDGAALRVAEALLRLD